MKKSFIVRWASNDFTHEGFEVRVSYDRGKTWDVTNYTILDGPQFAHGVITEEENFSNIRVQVVPYRDLEGVRLYAKRNTQFTPLYFGIDAPTTISKSVEQTRIPLINLPENYMNAEVRMSPFTSNFYGEVDRATGELIINAFEPPEDMTELQYLVIVDGCFVAGGKSALVD